MTPATDCAIRSMRACMPSKPDKRRERRHQHAAEARRHGEAPVVRRLGQQERSMPLPPWRELVDQRALRIAGHREMMHRADAPVGKLDRGHAFRAVAGARERHQQRRRLRLEVEIRRTDQIGGGDRLDPPEQPRREIRREALADEGRRARAGQDRPRVGLFQERPDKTFAPRPRAPTASRWSRAASPAAARSRAPSRWRRVP